MVKNTRDIKPVKKVWGRELWIENSELFCLKLLELKPLHQCSLHMHPVKTETFLVIRGSLILEVGNEPEVVCQKGDYITLTPGTYHRFRGIPGTSGATIVEASTIHSDADVVRLEDSK